MALLGSSLFVQASARPAAAAGAARLAGRRARRAARACGATSRTGSRRASARAAQRQRAWLAACDGERASLVAAATASAPPERWTDATFDVARRTLAGGSVELSSSAPRRRGGARADALANLEARYVERPSRFCSRSRRRPSARCAWGCDFELFASPLNATLPRYCSLHASDVPFGSSGSFFDFDLAAGGNFEANPPFCLPAGAYLDVFERALDAAGDAVALSIALVVPETTDAKDRAAALRARGLVAANVRVPKGHAYRRGRSHEGAGPWTCPFGTYVTVLQTRAARLRWPAADLADRLYESFFADGGRPRPAPDRVFLEARGDLGEPGGAPRRAPRGKVYGVIQEYLGDEGGTEEPLWRLRHLDGDSEDLDEHELARAYLRLDEHLADLKKGQKRRRELTTLKSDLRTRAKKKRGKRRVADESDSDGEDDDGTFRYTFATPDARSARDVARRGRDARSRARRARGEQIPVQDSRTNVTRPGAPAPRGLVLGAINCNYEAALHVDKFNLGPSYIVGVGDYPPGGPEAPGGVRGPPLGPGPRRPRPRAAAWEREVGGGAAAAAPARHKYFLDGAGGRPSQRVAALAGGSAPQLRRHYGRAVRAPESPRGRRPATFVTGDREGEAADEARCRADVVADDLVAERWRTGSPSLGVERWRRRREPGGRGQRRAAPGQNTIEKYPLDKALVDYILKSPHNPDIKPPKKPPHKPAAQKPAPGPAAKPARAPPPAPLPVHAASPPRPRRPRRRPRPTPSATS
ncbi:hypothetical protein JL721_12976 [Aureococcus anophagefferens]|nr:hypothetical protein JL721_12976 [Aureococcus anophagefferens]